MYDLERFKKAQQHPHAGLATALAEIQAGQKQSHWIWYIFPQIEGLGASSMSERFAIADAGEAEAYLRDDLLRQRLVVMIEAVVGKLQGTPPASLSRLMGGRIDAVKLVSSLTLFRGAARRLAARGHAEAGRVAALCEVALLAANEQGFPPCQHTRARLGE